MNPHSLESSGHAVRSSLRPCRLLFRRATLFVCLSIITIIGILFSAGTLPDVKNYQLSWTTFNQTSLDAFSAWLWHLNSSHQYPQQINRSNEDLRLFDTLMSRAVNGSARYYFNDFEYFRMIREDFPLTQSAARLAGATGLVPLFPSTLDPKDVLFIIMGSAKSIGRARLMVETWLRWTKGNFFIFTETTNATVPMVSLPELRNKTTKADAQHRQLIGSQWLMKNRSDLVRTVKWFMFVDDDTWVNVPALFSYLQLFDHRVSLSLGYVWDHMWVADAAYFSGGAGVVLSQPAFVSMVPAIYSKECPFHTYNDVTWLHCQKRKGVTKIHSSRFVPETLTLVGPYNQLTPVEYVDKITFHYILNPIIARRMTCDVAAYWKWPMEGCETVKRENMNILGFRQKDAAKINDNKTLST